MKSMLLTKRKIVTMVLVVVALGISGVGLYIFSDPAQGPRKPAGQPEAATSSNNRPAEVTTDNKAPLLDSQIDRTIGREPIYKNKPLYCLVAVGPEAKKRIWV